jgi:hypothetical protein
MRPRNCRRTSRSMLRFGICTYLAICEANNHLSLSSCFSFSSLAPFFLMVCTFGLTDIACLSHFPPAEGSLVPSSLASFRPAQSFRPQHNHDVLSACFRFQRISKPLHTLPLTQTRRCKSSTTPSIRYKIPHRTMSSQTNHPVYRLVTPDLENF